MATENTTHPSGIASVGIAVRVARQRQGLTVDALGKRAGVSLGLISQLERGMGNPSFGSLQRLADALEVPLPKLISGVTNSDEMIVRESERRILPVAQDEPEQQRVKRELLTPSNVSVLQVIRSTIPSGFSNEGKAFRHLGVECILVERGSLVVMHGDRRVELAEGDSMTYECSVPHWWANPTDGETIVMGSVTPFEL